MSVYLKDGKVVLYSGTVATSATCCCKTGACCISNVCSIKTEANCTSLGGDYLGDDSVCTGINCSIGGCIARSQISGLSSCGSNCTSCGGHCVGSNQCCDYLNGCFTGVESDCNTDNSRCRGGIWLGYGTTCVGQGIPPCCPHCTGTVCSGFSCPP